MIVADNEAAVDLLYYEAITKTVVRLLAAKANDPLTIGIHGDWGAGKSSVLAMLESAYKGNDRILCVRFNGWLFQGYEDAKAVLIETIVEELLRKRSTVTKVADQAREVLKRVDWMKVLRKLGGLAFTATTGLPSVDQMKSLYGAASAIATKPTDAISKDDLREIASQASEYLMEATTETVPEQMHAFRREFEKLLKAADIEQLIVLVDDLDRCLPETSIETLEAIRLFLFVPQAAFVIAADEAMIEYAVRQHFPDLPISSGPTTYARNYLEKLIQVPFRLPALGYVETSIYVTLLLVQNKYAQGAEAFTKLIAVAREALRRPWAGPGLDRTSIAKALGAVPAEVESALQLASHITPILTDGARGNPRQIKRFINAMALRLAIAEERGFGGDMNPAVLAKIMLAERFAPEIYDVVARESAANGRSEALAALEAAVRAPAAADGQQADGRRATRAKSIADAAATLPDWPNLEWAKQWAAIDPPLGTVDLRPYVFVTRDRRNVFGSVAALGHLDNLLDRLTGPQLQARQATGEVQRLPGPDAEQLFDALRGRVSAADDLKEQPSGASGLVLICQHHAFLQPSLVAFLRSLPVAKIGPWAVSGWAAALTDAKARADFDALVADWATQSENGPLQAAAKAVAQFKSRKGG